MVKLFAIISKKDLEAVLAKKSKLSSVLRDEWENGGVTQELMASTQVPGDSETVTIEVAIETEGDLSQYVFEALDCPLAYKLPIALIDTGLVRAFSDLEMLEVARETVKSCMFPSPEPLWHYMMETPANQRRHRYGPYLTKAFDELTPKKEN